jgi:multiple sugar transport system ATP-binding protein
MNFIDATLVADAGGLAVRLSDGTVLALPADRQAGAGAYRDRAITLGVRPEHINRARDGESRTGLARCAPTIVLVQPTGSRTYGTFLIGGMPTVAELQAHDVPRVNQRLELAIDMNRAVLIDPQIDAVIQTGLDQRTVRGDAP